MQDPKTCAVLCEILADGVDIHRCAAARALGKFTANGQAAQTLTAALLDEDADVRTDAAVALGRLGDPANAPALLENLVGDPDGDVKKAALKVLIDMCHAPVLPSLRALAVSRSEDIVWDEDAFYTDGWDDWLDLQIMAIRGLGLMADTESLDAIRTALEDEYGQDVSNVAFGALLQMGAAGAGMLEDLFKTGNQIRRRRIALEVDGNPAAHLATLLSLCLNDPDGQVRLFAVKGLAHRPDGAASLVDMFDDENPDIRALVLETCGAGQPEKTVAAAADSSALVRKTAFSVMAAAPDAFTQDEISGTLEAALKDEIEVAVAAAMAWAVLAPQEALPMLGGALNGAKLPLEFRLGTIAALRRIGPDASRYLRHGASDSERDIRLASLTLLAEFAARDKTWPNPSATALLAALDGQLILPPEPTDAAEDAGDAPPTDETAQSGDEIPNLANELDEDALDPGTSTLEEILAPSAPEATDEPAVEIELSADDQRRLALAKSRSIGKRKVTRAEQIPAHEEIRQFAAELLGDVAHRDITARLCDLLASDDARLASNALASLSRQAQRLGGDMLAAVLPDLVRLLENGDDETPLLAARAIGYATGPEAEAKLSELLTQPSRSIRLEAVLAFDRRGVADARIVAQLCDSWPSVRLAAATTLANHKGPEAIDMLVDFAFSQEGMQHLDAARLLARCAPGLAEQRMLEVLADESRKRIWIVAIEVIDEMTGAPPDGDIYRRKVA